MRIIYISTRHIFMHSLWMKMILCRWKLCTLEGKYILLHDCSSHHQLWNMESLHLFTCVEGETKYYYFPYQTQFIFICVDNVGFWGNKIVLLGHNHFLSLIGQTHLPFNCQMNWLLVKIIQLITSQLWCWLLRVYLFKDWLRNIFVREKFSNGPVFESCDGKLVCCNIFWYYKGKIRFCIENRRNFHSHTKIYYM